jgi:hypothetical protein
MRKKWTSEEVEKLRELLQSVPPREAAAVLGRTYNAVKTRVKLLRISAAVDARGRKWTAEDAEFVRTEGERLGLKKLCAALGRSKSSVQCVMVRLGMRTRHTGKVVQWWTAEQDAQLQAMAATSTAQQAAELFGRSVPAVQARALRLGQRFVTVPGRSGRPRAGDPRCAPKKRVRKPRHYQAVREITSGAKKPALRRVEYEYRSALEWCRCGAPVSNWDEHYERLGHMRERMLARAS